MIQPANYKLCLGPIITLEALKNPPPKLQISAVTWPRSRFNTSGPDPLGFDWEDLAASRGSGFVLYIFEVP